jgi:hypothetical protein
LAAGRSCRYLCRPPPLSFHFLCPHSCPLGGGGSTTRVTILLPSPTDSIRAHRRPRYIMFLHSYYQPSFSFPSPSGAGKEMTTLALDVSRLRSCRRGRLSYVLSPSPSVFNICLIALNSPVPYATFLNGLRTLPRGRLSELCAFTIILISTPPKALMSMVGHRLGEGLVEHMDRVAFPQKCWVRIS